MSDIRLTKRGKIVVVLAVIAMIVGVNALVWGKGIGCDWRGEIRACEVTEMP